MFNALSAALIPMRGLNLLPGQIGHVDLFDFSVFPGLTVKYVLVSHRVQAESKFLSLKDSFEAINLVLSFAFGNKRALTHRQLITAEFKPHVLSQVFPVTETMCSYGKSVCILNHHRFGIGFSLHRFAFRDLKTDVVPSPIEKPNKLVRFDGVVIGGQNMPDQKNPQSKSEFQHIRLVITASRSSQTARRSPKEAA